MQLKEARVIAPKTENATLQVDNLLIDCKFICVSGTISAIYALYSLSFKLVYR